MLLWVLTIIGNGIRHPYTRDGIGFSIHFYRPQSPSVVHVAKLRNVISRSEITQQHVCEYCFVGVYVASREDDWIIIVVIEEIVLIKIGTCVGYGWMCFTQIPIEGFIYIVTTLIEVRVAIKFPIDFLWVPNFPCIDILFLYSILPPCYHVTTDSCPTAIRELKGVVPACIYADAFSPILDSLCFRRRKWNDDAQCKCQCKYQCKRN